MALMQYTAEVKAGLLLELPQEAEELHLKPGERVEIRLVIKGKQAKFNGPTSSPTPHRVSAMGKYAGVLSSDDLIRRKREDIALEDRPRR
jgi:hypothetical protein